MSLWFPLFLYSNIYTQYTHNRIKENTTNRRGSILHALSPLLNATDKKGKPSPHVNTEGDGFPTKQVKLNDISSVDCGSDVVRSWRCKVLEKSTGRKWFVVCIDDAVSDSKWGWICDCGCWTFGDDKFHIPICKPDGIVRCGRVKKC